MTTTTYLCDYPPSQGITMTSNRRVVWRFTWRSAGQGLSARRKTCLWPMFDVRDPAWLAIGSSTRSSTCIPWTSMSPVSMVSSSSHRHGSADLQAERERFGSPAGSHFSLGKKYAWTFHNTAQYTHFFLLLLWQ